MTPQIRPSRRQAVSAVAVTALAGLVLAGAPTSAGVSAVGAQPLRHGASGWAAATWTPSSPPLALTDVAQVIGASPAQTGAAVSSAT